MAGLARVVLGEQGGHEGVPGARRDGADGLAYGRRPVRSALPLAVMGREERGDEGVLAAPRRGDGAERLVQPVNALLQGLPLPVARLLFLALTAAEKGDKAIGGLRPSTVEAEAWRSTQQVTAKPSAAAAAVLTSALGVIITGRGGSQVTSDSQALAAQDAVLQVPGTLAEMLLELIDHARQNGSLPASSIRWVRWTMPELAAGLLGARPLTAV